MSSVGPGDDLGGLEGVQNDLVIRCGLLETHASITGEDPNATFDEPEQTTTIAIARNTWVDVKFHILWNIGYGNGYVDAYTRVGTSTAEYTAHPRMTVGTMYNTRAAIFRLGIYRGLNQAQASLFNIGRVRISRTNNF